MIIIYIYEKGIILKKKKIYRVIPIHFNTIF